MIVRTAQGSPSRAKMSLVGFGSDVERKLLGASGLRCANPACRDRLLVERDGKVATVADMAHIIASSSGGPRGDEAVPPSERDAYENAVLLCPNCHRLVDNRKMTETYDEVELRRWKQQREKEVEEASGTPTYDTREELIEEIRRLLRENKASWQAVGPGGPEGEKVNPGTVGQWKRQSIETVIPNNWRILALGRRNAGHLTKEELEALAEFRVHVDGFAYNAIAEEPVEGQITFPDSMALLFE